MEDESFRHVTVSCPNHGEVLVRGLWNFFMAKRGVDFDFQFGGQSIKAHRLIMDVFLSSDKLNQNAEMTSLEWERLTNPDTLLEFIYNGKVVVPEVELENLLNTAKHFDFHMLMDAVEAATGNLDLTDRASEIKKDRGARSCRLNLKFQQEEQSGTSSEHSDWDEEWAAPEVPKRKSRCNRKAAQANLPARAVKKKVRTKIREKNKVESQVSNVDGERSDGDGGAVTEWLNNVEINRKSGCRVRRSPRPLIDHDGPDPVAIRKSFKCPECDYVGPNRSKLKTHSVCHSLNKPFRCDECSMLFRRKGDMVRHHKEIHLDMKRYMCELCGRKFTNTFALTRHRRVHTGEKPFACEICNPVRHFADRTTYGRHVRRHLTSEKNYMCAICGRTFVVRYNLNAHTKRCHKDGIPAVSPEDDADKTDNCADAQ